MEKDESKTGIDKELDYPFFLLFTMEKIVNKFADGDFRSGTFIIKFLEGSCPFKDDDNVWSDEIKKVDTEFKNTFVNIKDKKNSMYDSVRREAVIEEIDVLTDYWLRRYNVLMKIPKMKSMLYKPTDREEVWELPKEAINDNIQDAKDDTDLEIQDTSPE